MATKEPAPSMPAFLQKIADTFGITGPGTATLELQYVDGTFRWARVHSGPIGADELQRRQDEAA